MAKYNFGALILCGFCAYVLYCKCISQYKVWRINNTRLPWIHAVYCGQNCWHTVRVKQVDFFADAPISIVVSLEGIPVGVLGVLLTGSEISVYQMQGLKNANFRQRCHASYLITCAEELSIQLRCTGIRVQPANRNTYWNDIGENKIHEEILARRERLIRVYDNTPRAQGFHLCKNKTWWHKQLEGG